MFFAERVSCHAARLERRTGRDIHTETAGCCLASLFNLAYDSPSLDATSVPEVFIICDHMALRLMLRKYRVTGGSSCVSIVTGLLVSWITSSGLRAIVRAEGDDIGRLFVFCSLGAGLDRKLSIIKGE